MMNKLRVLHTADWHVGTETLEDAERCLDFMANHVEGLADPVDLIVIAGDIYDHRQVRQESEAARLAFEAVRRLSYCAPVFVLTGTPSHDGEAPLILRDIGMTYPVKVINQPQQWVLCGGAGKEYHIKPTTTTTLEAPPIAVITGIPAFTKQYFNSGSDIEAANREIAEALASIFAGMGVQATEFFRRQTVGVVPHILMGHYPVGGSYVHPSQPMTGIDIEISQDHLALALADINCLGHIHAAQKVNDRSFFSGSLFATDFGEYEEKGFYIHTLEFSNYTHHWERKKSEFVKTPSPKLVKINIDMILNPVEDDTLILQAILMAADHTPALDVDEKGDIVCRMEIKVYQDEAHKIDQEAINEYFTTMGLGLREFKLSINRIPRPNVRSAKILDADDLAEKVQLRAEIVNNPITDEILEKARLLQYTPAETLIENVSDTVRKEKTIEITED